MKVIKHGEFRKTFAHCVVARLSALKSFGVPHFSLLRFSMETAGHVGASSAYWISTAVDPATNIPTTMNNILFNFLFTSRLALLFLLARIFIGA